MCYIIVINKGEKEITTPRQFTQYFGYEPQYWEETEEIDIDSCLCQVDIEKTLTDKGVLFKMDLGDYYIGMLDEIKED